MVHVIEIFNIYRMLMTYKKEKKKRERKKKRRRRKKKKRRRKRKYKQRKMTEMMQSLFWRVMTKRR